MILKYIIANWRSLLIGVLLASNLTLGALWRHSANAYADYRDLVVTKGKAQQAATERAIEEQKQITKDVQDGYQMSIDYLRSHPVRVLPRPGSGSMPGISKPASGVDEAGGYPIPAAEELAAECAETTNQLNFLQGWVEKQEHIK